jgi:serine/threonine protein kinase
MDYYPYNLYQGIKKKMMNPIIIKLFMYQILKGLNYLSTISIAHRDIKLENVLCSESGVFKLCDFGSSSIDVFHHLF